MATDKKDAPPVATKLTQPDPADLTTEREIAEKRHTRLGGPFVQDRVDPTESTDEALAARTGKPTPREASLKGLKKYRTTVPMYREGVYVEADSIIAVPADEDPSRTWEEADKDAGVHFLFPPPADAEEREKAREKRIEAQERANRKTAAAVARRPEVMATAIAAREAAQPGSTAALTERDRDKKK
jgi:hypothetical protein